MTPKKVPRHGSFKVSGDTLNGLVEASHKTAFGDRSGAGGLGYAGNTSIVLLKNLTGSTIPRWGAMKPSAPLVPPSTNLDSFLNRVALTGLSLAANGSAFVAMEPVLNNELGRFLAPGHVVPVKVNKAEDLTYKQAKPSTTEYFEAVEDSDIQNDDRLIDLLWHETGTGVKWAYALLPGIRSARLTILGPCATFTTPAELPDTDFNTDWPGGCKGPNLLGLNYRTLASGAITFVPLFLESTSPFLFSSDEISHSCASSTIAGWFEFEVTTTDRNENDGSTGGELRFMKSSDSSRLVRYQNRLASWRPNTGGYLQFGPEPQPCTCLTFPNDLCISIPMR